MILDAKRPSEEIVNSVHVEQAYSYAIHPEVRCKIYGLCNGRQLSLFHTERAEPGAPYLTAFVPDVGEAPLHCIGRGTLKFPVK